MLATDPDVQTLYTRIKEGDIDLQPDFQRGEVWSKAKKQRLIDSILRDWHVPPIHVIEQPKTRKQEVLDGQQRLTAIRDFVAGDLPIDGMIQPIDERVFALNGKRFFDLDEDTRRKFNRFPIRVFILVDFKPSEPGELFYRLNQPTNLTSAEQRNAFFGPVREQIRALSAVLGESSSSLSSFGFTNSRGSFDDILSRVAVALERNTIAEKIKASDLADLYRRDIPLSSRTEDVLNQVARLFSMARFHSVEKVSLNKASLFTWLVFLGRSRLAGHDFNPFQLAAFFSYFEDDRRKVLQPAPGSMASKGNVVKEALYRIYDDRSSARVSDVSSVVLRDAVIWYVFSEYATREEFRIPTEKIHVHQLREAVETAQTTSDDALAKELLAIRWGRLSEA